MARPLPGLGGLARRVRGEPVQRVGANQSQCAIEGAVVHISQGQYTGVVARVEEQELTVEEMVELLAGNPLLLALARPERLAGLVLVNPAPDFTEDLMWPGLADHERQAILREGETLVVEEGLGEYVLTRRMFEEARDWLLLRGALTVATPVHILQGRADDVVPWRRQTALIERLTGADVTLDLVEGGDHRLSSPADLGRLVEAVERNRRSGSIVSRA